MSFAEKLGVRRLKWSQERLLRVKMKGREKEGTRGSADKERERAIKIKDAVE